MTQCEAEERCMRVAFEIELQWGSGKIDLGRIKNIATGRDVEECAGHDTPKTRETKTIPVKLVS